MSWFHSCFLRKHKLSNVFAMTLGQRTCPGSGVETASGSGTGWTRERQPEEAGAGVQWEQLVQDLAEKSPCPLRSDSKQFRAPWAILPTETLVPVPVLLSDEGISRQRTSSLVLRTQASRGHPVLSSDFTSWSLKAKSQFAASMLFPDSVFTIEINYTHSLSLFLFLILSQVEGMLKVG